ncbi:putative phytoene dehydrogenase [Paratrimastix pyriformis]|uniref:Phytoene dehydrogenase n=1 Tax=Paratrimastix pyriformis TaxID=342808 RepID=A0ABQ8UIF4_9EUKA|nr:putative phytoene dehydrogenase [Paratrimastix pyriformis]
MLGRLMRHLMPAPNLGMWCCEGFKFESGPNVLTMAARLQSMFPEDAPRIRAYLNDLDHIASWVMHIKDALMERGMQAAMADILRDPEGYSRMTLQQLLDRHFPHGMDSKMRLVLTGLWGFLGEQPSDMSVMNWAILWKTLEQGMFVLRPGVTVESFLGEYSRVIGEHGGQVILKGEVARILLEANDQGMEVARGVELANGTRLRADVVVSACALPILAQMVPGGLRQLSPKGAPPLDLEKMELSPTCDSLYVGLANTPQTATLLAPLTARSTWFQPSFDNSEEHRRALDELLGAEQANPEDVLDNHPPSLFVTNVIPASDAPSRVLSCCFIRPVSSRNYDLTKEAYHQWKARRLEGMLACLERCLLSLHPREGPFQRGILKRLLVCVELATDRTYSRYTGSPLGAIYGPANTPAHGLFRRFPPVTAIPHLWVAGQWGLGGSGMSGCMVGAILVAAEIDRSSNVATATAAAGVGRP